MHAFGFNPNLFATGLLPAAAAFPAAPAPGPAYAMPAAGMAYGQGFAIPEGFAPTVAAAPMERFVTTMSGGVILDKDGAPAGRIPEGAFVDLKDGAVYGADGAKMSLPAGATVDLFDMPDIADLTAQYKASTNPATTLLPTTGGGKSGMTYPSFPGYQGVPQFTAVNGQWGPGGITDFKGGAATAPAAGCDSHHGPSATQAGGKAMPTTSQQSSVGGTFGSGATTAALGGADKLGTVPGDLTQSLNELIVTLRELVAAMQATAGKPEAGKPVVEPPRTEQPTTETPSSNSNSSSNSDTSTSDTSTSS